MHVIIKASAERKWRENKIADNELGLFLTIDQYIEMFMCVTVTVYGYSVGNIAVVKKAIDFDTHCKLRTVSILQKRTPHPGI